MRATTFSRSGRIMNSKLKGVTAEPDSKERNGLRGTQNWQETLAPSTREGHLPFYPFPARPQPYEYRRRSRHRAWLDRMKGGAIMKHFTRHTTSVSKPGSRRRWYTMVRSGVAFVTTLLAGLMLLLLLPAGVRADSFTVTNLKDSGYARYLCTNPQYKDHFCTLRAAILASNANGQENTIYLPAGDYKLKSGLPPITSPRLLTIQGVGAGLTSIRGSCAGLSRDSGHGTCGAANEFRVFTVTSTGALWLIGVTISDGQDGYGGGIYNAGSLMVYTSTIKNNLAHMYGGGIYNKGWMYLQDTTVRNNFVHNFVGGGIFNFGTTEIAYSTISGNKTTHGYGAGIANGSLSPGSPGYKTLTLYNSTISGNESTGPGESNRFDAGGILNYGDGEVWLKNVTITANAVPGTFRSAGGVLNRGGFYFSNTIIAGNQGGGIPSDCGGQMSTLGGNLVGTTNRDCQIMPRHDWDPKSRSRANDQIGTGSYSINPQLARLADNGGNTCTHALNPTSPAINNAWTGRPDEHPFVCGRYDQRWVTRPSTTNGGYNCDIGAFELTGQNTRLGLTCTE